MKYKLLIFILLLISKLVFSQNIEKITFEHSNAMILFKSVNIILEPTKGCKKVKVIVKKDRNEEYTSHISKEKYKKIYLAIQKIAYDTVAVKDNIIDGTFTTIYIYDNHGRKKITWLLV